MTNSSDANTPPGQSPAGPASQLTPEADPKQKCETSQPGSLSAIIVEAVDRDFARSIAGALENLIDPAPDALSIFENEGPGTPWRITAYYDTPPDPAALTRELENLLGRALPVAAHLETVPDLNWVAMSQAALPPVQAGRFTIHGSHDRHRVPQGPGAILIDAGEAFGTAHHATTYGCLLSIDKLTRRTHFNEVLDLGCGTGVLAIALARANPHARIWASDIDKDSVEVAKTNFKANRTANRITAFTAEGLNHPALRGEARYDLLIANILAGPLIMLAGDIARAVASGSHLILSGLLDDQADEIVAHYRKAGFSLHEKTRIAGWTTLVLIRSGKHVRES
ncbi:MAG: 50S ribosomal protein L11 methyltransferase [Filomicrobium sp.]